MKKNEEKSRKSTFKMRYILYLVLLVLYGLAIYSHNLHDIAILDGGATGPFHNYIGRVGAWIAKWSFYLIGVAVYPMYFIILISILRSFFSPEPERNGYFWALFSVLFGLTIIFGIYPEPFAGITASLGIGRADEGVRKLALSGGAIGQLIAAPETKIYPSGIVRREIGEIGTLVIASAFFFSGLLFIILSDWKQFFSDRFTIPEKKKKPVRYIDDEISDDEEVPEEEEPAPSGKKAPYRVEPEEEPAPRTSQKHRPAPEPEPEQEPEQEEENVTEEPPAVQTPPQKRTKGQNAAPISVINAQNGSNATSSITSQMRGEGKSDASASQDYMLPPIKLFDEPKVINTEDTSHLEHSQNVLQSVLESFNVAGRVIRAVVGPRVTRFVIELDPGVKVGLVTQLQNNIAMEMKAESVRILAPIPGEGNIGVEVPNKNSSIVYIRSLFESEAWQNATGNASSIPIVLGRDVAGRTVIANLAKAPHLLIAGSTGSGKSVCMNSLIMSLLQKFSPDDLRLILVDPKHVELAMYRPIPHLITPVVNDPKQVPLALRWADNEMERRYRLLASVKAKNLKAFNSRSIPDTPELDDDGNPVPARLPLLVVIIDELADIMMTEAKKDVETSICRIAQKGRAAGIHLVIATQTPRKDVITGLIKANLPTKIAFRVTSGIDSRVILDAMGAESLLGNGDMLFMAPGGEGLERVQGTLVEDPEIQRVVDFISVQRPQCFDSQVVAETEVVDTNVAQPSKADIAAALEDDELHETSLRAPSSSAVRSIVSRYMKPGDNDLMRRALEIILEEKRVSTSYLQRRLGIGYNKSAELIDELEHRGIVSAPLPGGQKRDILILDELLETNNV
ncbi:MAG: DNA translocase FtsK 4TM domain-containing protein [Lentisphaeria bacterium]|nr:DNA translocase FtsK 4TM domain-containing protein [Lentisphaeria bacterium]